MIIYGAIIISLITPLILYAYFKAYTTWWEYLVPILASVLFVYIAKATIEVGMISSSEYIGAVVQKAVYFEDWDEYIEKTCTRQEIDGEDTLEVEYDCSYVKYHPEEYHVFTNLGEDKQVSESIYQDLVYRFGNKKPVDLHRDFHQIDGDSYEAIWDGSVQTAEPFTRIGSYENRIKGADQSVFNFAEIDTADFRHYNLKNYPLLYDYYRMDAFIDYPYKDSRYVQANELLGYYNGILGHTKQAHIFFLFFYNQPIDAAFKQEALWCGGNKNEFIVCVGLDKSEKVKWCKVISWTESEKLKVDVKNYVQDQKQFDPLKTVEYVAAEVEKQFVRRQFAEFNYLTIEPPLSAVITVLFLTIALNIGLVFWIYKNKYKDEK